MAEQTMTKKKGLKKGWRIVLGILAGLILLYAVLGVLPRRENYALANPMMKEGALPLLIAHGGGNKEFPDNTLEAFYNAYSVDKNAMMETDVSITRDGVVILSHDTTLDRKTNVTGRIIDWNYSDLMAQKVDFGYTNPTEEMQLSGERVRFTDRDGRQKTPADVEYPDGVTPRDEEVFLVTTLEELLAAFPQNRINVEIKQSGETGMKAMKEVLRLLEQYHVTYIFVGSKEKEKYGDALNESLLQSIGAPLSGGNSGNPGTYFIWNRRSAAAGTNGGIKHRLL